MWCPSIAERGSAHLAVRVLDSQVIVKSHRNCGMNDATMQETRNGWVAYAGGGGGKDSSMRETSASPEHQNPAEFEGEKSSEFSRLPLGPRTTIQV
jgi:carbonic anhydrase